MVPLDKSPVHGYVPEELVAGGTDECKDPIRILLDSCPKQTEGEDHNGRGVFQSIEVVWPTVPSLYRATKALHQTDPERRECQERNENISIKGGVLPGRSMDGFCSINMVGDPPINCQKKIDDGKAQVAEDTDKRS